MEIRYAQEMASIAKEARDTKHAKDSAMARIYLEKNLMKDIEDRAKKGENYLSRCLIAIEDREVKEALKNLLRNYGYKAAYSDDILEIGW